jgi:membrane fusion protein
VPDGVPLQAVLYIPTRAVGFVRVGQRVRLLYDAFPYQNFGTHRGRIVRISHTVLTRNDETGPLQLKEPVYEAVAALDRAQVTAYGRKMPLKPDMLLKADIILNKLSLMRWLIDPLLAKRW